MGFMDKLKKITGADEYDDNEYDDDGYYNDITDNYGDQNEQPAAQQTQQPLMSGYNTGYATGYQQPQTPPPSFGGGLNLGSNALQMKVVRPENFSSVSQIADHLLSQRTVVLNLEATDKETTRRLIDFLSGVAYSIDGSLKRIANNAYIITPSNVDVSGDQLREQRRGQSGQRIPETDDEDGGSYRF